jgi:hypothetical protein
MAFVKHVRKARGVVKTPIAREFVNYKSFRTSAIGAPARQGTVSNGTFQISAPLFSKLQIPAPKPQNANLSHQIETILCHLPGADSGNKGHATAFSSFTMSLICGSGIEAHRNGIMAS